MLGHNVGMFARVAQANQQPTTLMPGTMLSGSYNGSGWKGHNLYWLKNQRPELFQPIDPKTASLINESMKPPEPGFQVFCDGWFMNPQTEEFIDAVTNQRYALVRESGEYCLVREGESWDAELSVGAADASTSSGIRGTAAPCKKLFIADLHRAAQVLKLDLSHLDRPAALFAVFDADGADCVSLAETAAKLFHSKLLPRLAGYRGEWSPDQVKEALSLALTRQTPAGKDGKAPATVSAAAALLIGRRLTVIASGPGARCVLSSPRYAVAGSSAFAVHSPEGSWEGYPKEPVKDLVRSPETEESSAEATKSSSSSSGASTQRILPNALPSSLQLTYHKVQIGAAASLPSGASAEASETESSLLAMNQRGACCDLDVGGQFQSLTLVANARASLAKLSDDDVGPVAAQMVAHHRPRAGSCALVKVARERKASGALIVAMVNLLWASTESTSSSGPAAKRARTEERPAGDKVRVRHILLRHAASASAEDSVRRRKVTRSLEQAEELMLAVLQKLETDLSLFTSECRKLSECQSSLKGGELAGDLGWLSRDKPSSTMPEVHKAAFNMGIGQLSDIVISKNGVHVILRTA